MDDIDFDKLLGYLDKGLELAQLGAELAGAVGVPGAASVASIVDGVADIGQNVLARIEDGVLAATADNKEQLAQRLGKLRALNDAEEKEALQE
jgi:hypothetical protein